MNPGTRPHNVFLQGFDLRQRRLDQRYTAISFIVGTGNIAQGYLDPVLILGHLPVLGMRQRHQQGAQPENHCNLLKRSHALIPYC
ncbi:hypothetical protein D3C79_891980 [compost metagenome]